MPRKVAYSGKKKREQLRQRKERKRQDHSSASDSDDHRTRPTVHWSPHGPPTDAALGHTTAESTARPPVTAPAKGREDKLLSQFDKLTREQIQANRLKSMEPLVRLPKSALEIAVEDVYTGTIAIPQRPPWKPSDSKHQLEARETQYFATWINNILDTYGPSQLNFFEKNLEVWRQLWRVVEISDVVLVVTDIRHPLLHFPPSLYDYVVQSQGKKMILVLNKADLVTESIVDAWRDYFQRVFPELLVTTFACFEQHLTTVDETSMGDMRQRLRQLRSRRYKAHGAFQLLQLCRDVAETKPGVDVAWDDILARYTPDKDDSQNGFAESDDSDSEDQPSASIEATEANPSKDQGQSAMSGYDSNAPDVGPHHQYVTLGLVGHPNVGKSTLINSLVGRVVVSASKTPGHTKHFQTIHLSKELRLCDCPGLMFPSLVSKPLQILTGLYNIAQVQEPYTPIQFMAERLPVENILKLEPTEDMVARGERYWSAWTICEAYAMKRGYFTPKGKLLDVYRAVMVVHDDGGAMHFVAGITMILNPANAILRLVVDGRILLSFKPPHFYRGRYEGQTGTHIPLVPSDDSANRMLGDDDPSPTPDDPSSWQAADSGADSTDEPDSDNTSAFSPTPPTSKGAFELLGDMDDDMI
ncbi:hypothetical protein H4R35_001611 [Dimargaris xerosporica]|nr:hypothetical protein H4R35_001611 [Dimargaris xerosporica]